MVGRELFRQRLDSPARVELDRANDLWKSRSRRTLQRTAPPRWLFPVAYQQNHQRRTFHTAEAALRHTAVERGQYHRQRNGRRDLERPGLDVAEKIFKQRGNRSLDHGRPRYLRFLMHEFPDPLPGDRRRFLRYQLLEHRQYRDHRIGTGTGTLQMYFRILFLLRQCHYRLYDQEYIPGTARPGPVWPNLPGLRHRALRKRIFRYHLHHLHLAVPLPGAEHPWFAHREQRLDCLGKTPGCDRYGEFHPRRHPGLPGLPRRQPRGCGRRARFS